MAGVIGLVIGGGAVALWAQGNGGVGDRAEIEKVVHAYLLEHPEVLPEAMERLQEREAGQAVAANRAAYETPFAGAWAGAKDADVTLVEFFDYSCGYCRRSNADVARLLAEDKKLKVVWREWPVLGPDSEKAAQVSLAAAKAGKFHPYFERLYGLGRPTDRSIEQAARDVGVTAQMVQQLVSSGEARAELGKNYQLAQAVRGNGTPVFVVGDKVLHGAVGYDALKKAIADARRS
ncbi:DsbA family protein [Sphingosinicella sp. BN140058]|nr:DsbA family protein [Sphingosinicella sp. BN140058]